MTSTTTARWASAAAVALAPVVLLAAFLTHPYIATLPNASRIAELVEANPTRWAVAHLLTAVASGLLAVAFLAVRSRLRDAGEQRWSHWGLPLVVFGSALYAFLPGVEFAPLAAVQTGGDVTAVQAALEPWFIPVLATGALSFGAGVLAFAAGVANSRVLGTWTTRGVVTALIVMAVSRIVPLGAVQFQVQGIAALVALWPLATTLAPGRDRAATTVQHPSAARSRPA